MPPLRVSPEEIRRLFNENSYWERARKGEFTTVLLRGHHRSPPGEPFCTHSQMISYRDQSGREVALVHQYLRPDGSLGASGQPDPKRLLHMGVLYLLGGKSP